MLAGNKLTHPLQYNLCSNLGIRIARRRIIYIFIELCNIYLYNKNYGILFEVTQKNSNYSLSSIKEKLYREEDFLIEKLESPMATEEWLVGYTEKQFKTTNEYFIIRSIFNILEILYIYPYIYVENTFLNSKNKIIKEVENIVKKELFSELDSNVQNIVRGVIVQIKDFCLYRGRKIFNLSNLSI